MCYMASVILTSWRDLGRTPSYRHVALLIGLGSVSIVWLTLLEIRRSTKAAPGAAHTHAVRVKPKPGT